MVIFCNPAKFFNEKIQDYKIGGRSLMLLNFTISSEVLQKLFNTNLDSAIFDIKFTNENRIRIMEFFSISSRAYDLQSIELKRFVRL